MKIFQSAAKVSSGAFTDNLFHEKIKNMDLKIAVPIFVGVLLLWSLPSHQSNIYPRVGFRANPFKRWTRRVLNGIFRILRRFSERISTLRRSVGIVRFSVIGCLQRAKRQTSQVAMRRPLPTSSSPHLGLRSSCGRPPPALKKVDNAYALPL